MSSPGARRWARVTGVAAVVVAGAGLVAVPRMLDDPAPKPVRPLSIGTAAVVRGDVTEQVRATGRLAFARRRDLGTSLTGTVTSVPRPGTVLGRGAELFRVDDRPVLLLLGRLPAWRAFAPGMSEGPDVRQLELNLAALGFFDAEPDETFTAGTAEAIRDWQESGDLERSGVLPLGTVVFQPERVRVASVTASPGAAAGPSVLAVTSAHRVATVDLDADLVALVAAGRRVEVTLPGGGRATGRVRSVGTPREKDQSDGGGALVVPVTIALGDPPAARDLVDVAVSAIFVRRLARNVLQVPIMALIAGPGGTTSVEVREGGRSRRVEVRLGAFGAGVVEVAAEGLTEGAEVVVAQ